MNIVIIPAKKHSSRLENKNMRLMNNKPMLYYSIKYAKKYKQLKEIFVSTDSDEIEEYALSQGVKVIRRGKEFCGDASMIDVCKHALNYISFVKSESNDPDFMIVVQPDHPNRTIDLNNALEIMNNEKYDSLLTYNDENGYEANGALKIFNIEKLLSDKLINIGYMLDNCENIHFLKDFIRAESNMKRNKKKLKVLITAPMHFMRDLYDVIEEEYDIHYLYNADRKTVYEYMNSDAELIDILIPNPGDTYRIDSEFLDYFKNIKLIVTPSTGKNHIDLDYCDKHNITVLGLLDNKKFTESISASAEFTWALMLSLVRRIPAAIDYVKNGSWRKIEDKLRTIEIQGKNIGIVGQGRIGTKIKNYAKPFEPNYIYTFDIINPKNSLEALLKNSDIIFICVTLNDETKGMVDKEWFMRMKDECYFINTSRGEVINENDLIDYLDYGKILGAAVDVVCDETNIANNKLIAYSKKYKNLLVTPHIAGLTIDSQRKAMLCVIEFLENL